MKRGHIAVWYTFIVLILGSLVAVYFISSNETVKLLSLILLGVVVILLGVFIYLEHGHGPTKLQKKIKEINEKMHHETSDSLKKEYLEVHNIYNKLKPDHQKKFFGHVKQLREQMTGHLTAEKKIEKLFKSLGSSLAQQKKSYLKIHDLYQKLPEKVKEKFYTQLIDLKQKLDGKK